MNNTQSLPRALLIAGPTASGKSRLALQLAQAYKGSIINADSMQVYAEMRILTARPSKSETDTVPHYLYGHISATQTYNVAIWVKQAMAAIEEIEAGGRLPIFVGGTGLYFRALLEGLADIPDIPPAIRAAMRKRLAAEGLASLYEGLQEIDPTAHQRLAANDTQRILRAWEVYQATARPLSDWQKEAQKKPPMPPFTGTTRRLLLMPDREWLYARCNQRFADMLAAGAMAEAQKMAAMRLPADAPPMKALGLPALLAVLDGTETLENAQSLAQQQTRNYAKRQMTWFRNQILNQKITWKAFNMKDYYKNQQKIFSYITKKT